MKKQANENALRLDSLIIAYEQSNKQLGAIRNVLTGNLVWMNSKSLELPQTHKQM